MSCVERSPSSAISLPSFLPPLSDSPSLSTPPAHPTRTGSEPEPEASKVLPPTEPKALKPRPTRGVISANAIGQLQEIAQQAKVKLPSYEPRGSHPNFECLCRFKFLGDHHFAEGSGLNKKAAKIDAAVELLKELGYSVPGED